VRLFDYRLSFHERGWVQKRLLEAWEFEMAALEFGGDRRCQQAAAEAEAAAEQASKGKEGSWVAAADRKAEGVTAEV